MTRFRGARALASSAPLLLLLASAVAQAEDNGCRMTNPRPGDQTESQQGNHDVWSFAIVSDFTSFETSRLDNGACSLGGVLAWQNNRLNHTSAVIGNGLIILAKSWPRDKKYQTTAGAYFQGNGTDQTAGAAAGAPVSETMVLGGFGQATFRSNIAIKPDKSIAIEPDKEGHVPAAQLKDFSPVLILRSRGGYEINTTGVRSVFGGIDVQTSQWSNAKLRLGSKPYAEGRHVVVDNTKCTGIWFCVTFVPEITMQYDHLLRAGGTRFQLFARSADAYRLMAQVIGQAHLPGVGIGSLPGLAFTLKVAGAADPVSRQDYGFVQTGLTYDFCQTLLQESLLCSRNSDRSPTKLGLSVSYAYGNNPLTGILASQIQIGLVVGLSAPGLDL